MNNKGAGLQDLIIIMAGFLTVVLTVITVLTGLNFFNDEWQDIDDIPQQAKDLLNDRTNSYLKVFDNSFMFLAVGSALALFFGAAMLRSNPVFFIFGTLLLAVITIASLFLKDVYEAFVSVPVLSDTAADLVVIPFIMTNLPTMIVVTGFLMLIGLYMKVKQVREE